MATYMCADAAAWLRLHNITKTFPGVVANDRVNLEVRAGEVRALLGENGAGKTTLMRILYGLYQPDTGDMRVRGRPVQLRAPRDAIALGIGLVPEHFLLVRRHTVAENIALGLPGARFFFPVRQLEARIRDVAERYGLPVDPGACIWQLSPGEQQRVAILKALLRGSEILILDEPTALLTPQETSGLFSVLARMRAQDGRARARWALPIRTPFPRLPGWPFCQEHGYIGRPPSWVWSLPCWSPLSSPRRVWDMRYGSLGRALRQPDMLALTSPRQPSP